jgi:hypothetical protein
MWLLDSETEGEAVSMRAAYMIVVVLGQGNRGCHCEA